MLPAGALYIYRFAAYLVTNVASTGVTLKYLRPMIEERLQKIKDYGFDYPDKPVSPLSQSI